jgi:hypothetical protein
MQIFLDTADVREIRELSELGVVNGVTTNPSIIAKEGRPFREIVDEILSLVDGPISLEVVSTDAAGMVQEARELARLHKNVVVKIPLIPDGLKAVRQLSSEGVKTNVTLCFSAPQALLAAKAGATYISPFVHDAGLGRQPSDTDSLPRGGAGGGGRMYAASGRAAPVDEAPADRHRPRRLSGGLEKGTQGGVSGSQAPELGSVLMNPTHQTLRHGRTS